MKKLSQNKNTNGTSSFGVTILTSIEQLKKINVFPVCEQNDGQDKTNFDFELETEAGEPFTIYDWKYYRPIEETELVNFHIGSYTLRASERAKKELEESLKNL